ncbi:MAG TPA: tetratricopeptide repeat protein [Paucimonas sp.]|nr:tetratricopeptide repeat protein [Paucimonas sp.]
MKRIVRLNAYLEQDPLNPHLLSEMIDLHVRVGDLGVARAVADKAVAAYPDDVHFQCQLANVMIEEGNLDQAEAMLGSVLDHADRDPGIVYNLAFVHFVKRRFDEVLRLFAQHPDALERHTQARMLQANSLHHLGKTADALDAVKKRLEAAPNDYAAMGMAGLLEFDLENPAQAERWARSALAGEPDNLAALVALGSVALFTDDFAQAQELFEHAISVKSNDGRSWFGLALANMSASKLREALPAFNNAAEYLPAYANVRLSQGWCALLLGDISAAESSFRRALEIDRNFAECHGSLAVSLVLQQRRQEAGHEIELALRLDSTCLSARYAEALASGEIKDISDLTSFAARIFKKRDERDGVQDLSNIFLRRLATKSHTTH